MSRFLSFNDDFPFVDETGKEPVTLMQMFSFVKTHSKVHVQIPGCVKELDELAVLFVNEPNKRKDIRNESEEFIEKMECKEVSEPSFN